MARQFFDGGSVSPAAQMRMPPAELLRRYESSRGPNLQDAWLKSDMQNQQPLPMGMRDAAWAAEFGGGMSSQQKSQPAVEGPFESST